MTNNLLNTNKSNITHKQTEKRNEQFTSHWFGIKKLTVNKNQLALLFTRNTLEAVYIEGEYRLRDNKNKLTVEFVDLHNPLIEENLAQYLQAYLPETVKTHCWSIELNETEIGLRYENEILVEIMPPTTQRLYWNGPIQHRVEVISVNETIQVADELIRQLMQPLARAKKITGAHYIFTANIPAYHAGILKIDGEIQPLLSAGTFGYWLINRDIQLEIVDMRISGLEITGQEILTRDKVNLRINLIANWKYENVLHAHQQLTDIKQHLYRELQFALREAIGTRTLDELLENKEIINQSVQQRIDHVLNDNGLAVVSLGVKDIILPGDMKTILAQVVEAEKAAQANVIKRREETSATRSLLNTAKVMENSPVALRLKELETLERVAERINNISVYGGLDNVLNGLVNIKPST